MSESGIKPKEKRPPVGPELLLARPLTLPCDDINDFAVIDAERRDILHRQRHFLLRGTSWIKELGVLVTSFKVLDGRSGLLDHLPEFALGGPWEKFCQEWEFERIGSDGKTDLGVGLIQKYIYYNSPKGRRKQRDPNPRFLTFYRAAALVAYFHSYLKNWFERSAKNRARFKKQFGRDYSIEFLLNQMTIEPIIYKLSQPSENDFENLFKTTITEARAGTREIKIDPDFLSGFRQRVRLGWDDRSARIENVIEEIFVWDRCSDYDFIRDVTEFTAEFLNLSSLPRIRHATAYRGPANGIVQERFYDITRNAPIWSASGSVPAT